MLMSLGLFIFTTSTIPFQSEQDSESWRHPSNARVGKRPAYQFTGKDEATKTLSGTLFPELTGGMLTIDMLRYMADTGAAWPLIRGDGMYEGLWIITDLSTTRTLTFANGQARQIDFSMTLKKTDDFNLVGEVTDYLLTFI